MSTPNSHIRFKDGITAERPKEDNGDEQTSSSTSPEKEDEEPIAIHTTKRKQIDAYKGYDLKHTPSTGRKKKHKKLQKASES